MVSSSNLDLDNPTTTIEATTASMTSEAVSEATTGGRRSQLPVPMSDNEGINLWNLLCKNIGKDLSKISMPVTVRNT